MRVEVREREGFGRGKVGNMRIDIFADDCRIVRQIGLVMLDGENGRSRTGGRENNSPKSSSVEDHSQGRRWRNRLTSGERSGGG